MAENNRTGLLGEREGCWLKSLSCVEKSGREEKKNPTAEEPVSKAVNPAVQQQFIVCLLPAIVLSACRLTFCLVRLNSLSLSCVGQVKLNSNRKENLLSHLFLFISEKQTRNCVS